MHEIMGTNVPTQTNVQYRLICCENCEYYWSEQPKARIGFCHVKHDHLEEVQPRYVCFKYREKLRIKAPASDSQVKANGVKGSIKDAEVVIVYGDVNGSIKDCNTVNGSLKGNNTVGGYLADKDVIVKSFLHS